MTIERAESEFSAYSPDLPGCVATGDTREEAEANMYEALQWHLAGLQEDNVPIPEPSSTAWYMLIPTETAAAGT